MRLLITGSSGQIGTNLALRCLGSGHQVAGIDCRENGWTDAFESVRRDLRRFDGTTSSAAAGLGCERPDVVVHLAAHAKVHDLVCEPDRAFQNIAMTHNVLEYCRRLKVPIIFASSREVYGEVSRHTASEDDADFVHAASAYSASKLSGESMIYAYARCYDLPYIVYRLSNVYGRYDNDLSRMERVVPLFIDKVSRDEPVTVYGAEKVIDFTYIDDCIDGLVSGMERLVDGRLRAQTINLAYGEGHTLLDMVEYVGEALGRRPKVTLARPLVGEITRYVANIDRARALLDFAPKVPLHDGIRRAVAWGREWSMKRGAVDSTATRTPQRRVTM